MSDGSAAAFHCHGLEFEEANDGDGLSSAGKSLRSSTSSRRVKQCFFCKLYSTAGNELVLIEGLTILWHEVHPVTGEPKGAVCRICWTTYNVAGFKDKRGGLKQFKAAFEVESNLCLVKEFQASRRMCVELLNTGKMQLVGRPTNHAEGLLKDARQRVVDDLQKDLMEVDAPMKHMTADRYKETHNGRSYVDDGLPTRTYLFL